MRTAVFRVVVDPDSRLSAQVWADGIGRLRAKGLDVVASSNGLSTSQREIELVIYGFAESETETYVELCAQAFGTPARAGVVTYVSRGTDADARGVLDAFGVSGEVERRVDDGEEVVIVRLQPADTRRVPESRLHTALEAALNCEVRIVT